MKKLDCIGLAKMSIKLKKQQQIFLSVIIGVLILIISIFAIWGNASGTPKVIDKPTYKKHQLASPISMKNNESHWIEKTQNAWKEELEKAEKMGEDIKGLNTEKDKHIKLINAQKDDLSDMKAQLVALKQQVVDLQSVRSTAQDSGSQKFEPQAGLLPRADEGVMGAQSTGIETGFIQYSARLSKIKKPRIKTPDNYVFSNTFAKAVVLQGADASAGVLNQSNPDIMMFQILDDGVMPNGHKSHLRKCFFSASVVGDISSERGKLRTERLSCIHPDGTSIDTQVTGIVADSKNGIRGRAVWRDEPMVRKAFWGNFWESMGNIGQQYATDYSVSPLGSVATIQTNKIPLAAASSGGAGAAKMYAQYNIKRAEMYHPIIQLPPGTIVDVTFLKGFWLDGGTDSQEPERIDLQKDPQTQVNFDPQATSETPEEKAANQFFYQNHSF